MGEKGKLGALTVQDIAVDMNVDDETVRRWIAQKKLTAFELPGSKKQPIVRIRRVDYQKFLDGARRA